MNSYLAILLKKQYIEYNGNSIEILVFKDIVYGILFMDEDDKQCFNIVTGNHAGLYASVLNKSGNEEKENIVVLFDLKKAVEANNNIVDFVNIRKNLIDVSVKYYIRQKEKISPLIDSNLISIVDEKLNEKSCDFNKNMLKRPTDISHMYSSIKQTVISQDEQIMQILTSLFKNQKVINSNLDIDLITKLKENILIYGPTGTGKTEILKRIAEIFNIPIIIEDATSLSETGYHGRNISDMLDNLYLAANKDIEKAEKGILVIDEFDKLADKSLESYVSRLGVQRGLLKLLDGTTFYLDKKEFNTSKLTIVALGAFTGIAKGDNYKNLTTKDFVSYGIMRELISRFSKNIPMNSLTNDDLKMILKESKLSPLNTYRCFFESIKINFEYSEEFIDWLANKAVNLNSGARCLKTIFDDCISSAMFNIFDGSYSNISLVQPEKENDKPYILTKK